MHTHTVIQGVEKASGMNLVGTLTEGQTVTARKEYGGSWHEGRITHVNHDTATVMLLDENVEVELGVNSIRAEEEAVLSPITFAESFNK